MVWQTGKRLQGGKFEIIEILGQGGFGITYKARNRVLDIDVVIKTPNTLQRRDSEYDQYIQQFQEEGRKLARFSANPHPHIVRILDIFLEDQVPCLVMDFIQGQTLMEKVKNQGSLSESECLKYIRQIGDALVTVHQAGFVHRDAHPGNIMIQPNGKAVLIDFGIAKNIIPATRSSTNNAANLSFAPYEQIYKGSNASREPNVDVYSLAATFYYAITGKFPTPSMERRLDNRPLIPPQQFNRQLSGHINDAIVLGMALEKENRPQSMSAWLRQLQLDLSPPPVTYQYRKEFIQPVQIPRKIINHEPSNLITLFLSCLDWVIGLFLHFALFGSLGYVLTKFTYPWWGIVIVLTLGITLALALSLFDNKDVALWIGVPINLVVVFAVTWFFGASGITKMDLKGAFIIVIFNFYIIYILVWFLGKGWIKLEKKFKPFHRFLILNCINFAGLLVGYKLFFDIYDSLIMLLIS